MDRHRPFVLWRLNTTYCILPAGKVDNRPVGDGVPGPVTRQLQSAWSELVGIDFVDQALNAVKL